MSNETHATTTAGGGRTEESAALLAEHHKAVLRRWIEAYNDRDDQGEADARAHGYIAHAPGEPAPLASQAWTEFIGSFAAGFPDLRLTVEDVVADEHMVAARVSFSGTHTGEFQSLPPTNKKVAFGAVEINRMMDGKVAEHWVQLDQVAMLRQLGMLIIPGPRLLIHILVHQAKKLGSRLPGRAS